MASFAAVTLLVAAVTLAAPNAATAAGWVPPTAGAVTRGFHTGPDPFAGGQHRGADFEAVPGTRVQAACRGKVIVAGRIGSSGRVVTIACGGWRVTHMPLADVAVRPGESVRRGALLGTVAGDPRHAGVHLGVRRDGRRFGYVDPLQFIGAPTAPPVVAPSRRTRPDRRAAPRRDAGLPTAGSSPVATPARVVAPWFVWVGLGLLLAGGVGAAGVRLAPRRGRRAVPRAAPQEVP